MEIREYDSKFFEYVNSGSIRSAREVLPVLMQKLSISGVLDVGCGQGAWLSVWRELGIEDVTGIDGDYVQRNQLLIPMEHFFAKDLMQGFDMGRQFDLVQSLEVAEHLPASRAQTFVDSIVAHGKLVLFSAAAKGQGGDHHVNEQDYDYWRALFRARGYVVLDCIRPEIKGVRSIEPWYRYNTFLYVHQDKLSQLPEKFLAHRVPNGEKLRDVSPWLYKLRKLLVRLLPVSLATHIGQVKEVFVARTRRNCG